MVEIVISGDLETLLRYSLQMKALTEYRKSAGWELFQDDEEWIYKTREDKDVCDVCRTYGLTRSFYGPSIPMIFPAREVQATKTELLPRIHATRPWLRGLCRCIMHWLDAGFVLTERLGRELISAMK